MRAICQHGLYYSKVFTEGNYFSLLGVRRPLLYFSKNFHRYMVTHGRNWSFNIQHSTDHFTQHIN